MPSLIPSSRSDRERLPAIPTRQRAAFRGHGARSSGSPRRSQGPRAAEGSIREALARAYYGLGRLTQAREEFKAATEIDPTNDYAHFGLALCLERAGDFDRARAHAKLAVAMRPENDDYRKTLRRLEPDE